jgi:SAM-dependent methyltransferase
MVPRNFNPTVSHPLYFIRKGLFDKISLYSPELQGRLLDFGCGEKPYKDLFINVTSYIGLDYDGGGHDHTNENVDVYYDGKTIPFEDETFDSFFSSEVFEHVFTLNEILPEINRVIKPGGKMLLTCPFAWEEHEIPYDYARYTQFALKDMLEKNGFIVQKIDKNGHFISALHQIFMVYLTNEWIHRVAFFSRFNFFKKIIRKLVVHSLNLFFKFFEPLWPKSNKFYLNTIIVAEKKS